MELLGTEFSSLPAHPVISTHPDNAGVHVVHVQPNQQDIVPVSGVNVCWIGPLAPHGFVTVEFDRPVVAVGAWFLDVENGYATTGFDLDRDGTLEVRFSGSRGNRSQAFLGFITDIAVSSVDIYLSDGVNDGIAIDDVSYIPGPPFDLGFEPARRVSCDEDVTVVEVFAELDSPGIECEEAGATAWSIGVASEGCTIVAATTAGTVAAPSPDGFLENGFERTELTTGPGNEGAVSTVVLSNTGAVSLPPCETHPVLDLFVEKAAPAGSACVPGRLRYVDGLRGSDAPVLNSVSHADETVRPGVHGAEISFCPCTVTAELVPAEEERCVLLTLRSEVPFRGGELGIAYDAGHVTPTGVSPGADFPGSIEDLYHDLGPEVQCPEDVASAGFIAGWVNEGTGVVVPAGEYELLRICFEPSEGPEGGLCSPLTFVDCLGVPEAVVVSKVTGENGTIIPVQGIEGEVCGTDDPFRRGDTNGDGSFDIVDPLVILGCLFVEADCPGCSDAADSNDDGEVNIADALHLLNWRFRRGGRPPAPFPGCGIDRTADALGECVYAGCPSEP